MSRILVDFERLKYRYTGLGQFSYFLAKELAESDLGKELVFLLPDDWLGRFGVASERVSLRRRYFPRTCPSYDIWHSTHQDSAYGPAHAGESSILTIHDLNFLASKTQRKREMRARALQKKIDRACEVTAISKFTAEQVKANFDLKGKDIEVIYNGLTVEDVEGRRPPELRPEVSNRGFLLSVGVLRAKKNTHVLIPMLKHLPDVSLVLAGGDPDEHYHKLLQKSIRDHGVESRVQLLGEVNNGEKRWLLENCQSFVFPSLLEGFGLPVIEAMSFGQPVFISNLTSLPEIGGKEAFIWDSFDPQEMAKAYRAGMLCMSQDSGKPERLRAHAQSFSWKTSAAQYLQLYCRLLSKAKKNRPH